MEKRNTDGLTEIEFLAQYNPGNYEKPSVTVDVMVLKMKEDLSSMQILLIQRKNHPYIYQWALPGGFVEMQESAYEAACRELKEETGLANVYMEQLYTMSQPNRDPRMRVIDIAYIALLPYEVNTEAVAGDDAQKAVWFDVSFNERGMVLSNKEEYVKIVYVLEEKSFNNGRLTIRNQVPVLKSNEALAFDHSEIILEGLSRLKNKVMYTDVAFNLVPEKFSLPELQKVYEVILGKGLYKANFRDKVEQKVVSLERKYKPVSGAKIATLYRYKENE